jgi:O-antigen ligase
MEAATVAPRTLSSGAFRRLNGSALSVWALALALVLYLGIDGGGYDLVVRNQAGIVVWWVVLVGAAFGILPAGRIRRLAWSALAAFGAFVVWTALASTWSLSSERSLQELSRVASYLGILLLAVAIHRDRERAVRHTVGAVATAITVIGVLAVVSRLFPGSFPASTTTGAFLGGSQPRLSWPLNYWNGLADLMALGLPLLLSIATSARTFLAQAAAAAAIPILALCAYLTASRGGAIVIGIAVIVFIVLASGRLWKLATILVSAGGSAALIAGAKHRGAIQNGLTNHAAVLQGKQLLLTIVLVCAGVAVAQIGIGLAARHGTLPRFLRPTRRRAAFLTAGFLVVLVAAALAAGVPGRLSHGWQEFKNAPPPATAGTTLISRLNSLNGNGRYQFWKVAIQATSGRRWQGSGPGTFQLLWLPRETAAGGYVTDAHSLYVETLAEDGVVGLALLVGFLLVALGAAVRLVITTRDELRTQSAGIAAAMVAFLAAALVEWVWQLPVIPAAFLLLAAAVFAPRRAPVSARTVAEGGKPEPQRSRLNGTVGRIAIRLGLAGAAVACLIAIAVPLATTVSVRQSQQAANAGDTRLALTDARSAARVEPGAASPQLQLALVFELRRDYPAALAAARKATGDESQNWALWLTLSRIEAESGQVKASVADYLRARSLNPRSSLFHQ